MFEFTLANVLLMNNKNKEAVVHYLAALDLKPDYNPAWMNLGKVYYDLKEYQKAGHALIKGYETGEKKDAGTLFNACSAFLMADKKEKAIPYLEILVSGKLGTPKQEWVQSLLMVYIDLKLTKKASQMLKRLVDRYGDTPLWWRLSYQFYASQNDYQKAITALVIYSYLTPLKRDEIILLGDLLGVIGLPLEAARYYEKAIKSNGKPEEYEKLISFFVAAHRLKKARDMLNLALKKNPTAELWSLLGQVYYKEERYDDAFKAFSQAAGLDPKNGEYPLMMGYCALQLEKKDKAMVALQRASQFPKQRKIARELLHQVASRKER
jgi:tetratricopeptide (TPR) repeat protein